MLDHVLECVEDLGHPAAALPLSPDDQLSVLATRVWGHRQCPVPYPVRVGLQLGLLGPVAVLGLPPDLHQRVAASRHEPLDAGPETWRPTDILLLPGVVSGVGQHGDGPITGATDQDQTLAMRRPLDTVDTAVMVYILVDFGPLIASFLKQHQLKSTSYYPK